MPQIVLAKDMYVDEGAWFSWDEKIKKIDHVQNYSWLNDGTSTFYDIIVPTIESSKQSYLMKLFQDSDNHMLLTGRTGTGKSVAGKH